MVCNGKKKKKQKQKRRLQLLNTMVIKLQASSIPYSPIPTGRNPGCEQYTEGGETGERKLHQLQERRFEMDPQSNREF